jgi:glycosyltransferase involved in cell wall biosynthesis
MAGARAGGAELFFERLCRASVQAGDAILPIIRQHTARAARLQREGCAPLQFRFGGTLDFITRWQVGRALARFAPEVVVAWMNRAAHHTPVGNWALAGRLGGFYDLSYYRRCDHLIANTHGIVAWVRQQGWPSDRVRWLPNFASDFGGAAPLARAVLGVAADGPLVVALGRLHRNKAFDVLIRAMRHLEGVQLVIAGDGPERDGLQRLALREGVAARVHMPGWVDDVGGLLAAAHVLVCPSRHEPLGNVVIEGWSAARPVVATRAAGPAELIHSGLDGILVELEAPDALAAAVGEVLGRPEWAASLAQAGRARFEAEFAEAPVLAQWHAGLAEIGRR